MKKSILTFMSVMFMLALPVSAQANTLNDISNPNSPNHICRQLGTKVCHLENCTVKSYNNIQKPQKPTTETTTKVVTTTKPTTEATTETTTKSTTETTTKVVTTTKPTTEATTETTTKSTTETTTKVVTTTKPTTEATTETTTKTATTTKPTTEATTETTTVQQNGSYAQQVLNLVNAERAKHNLAPLKLSSSVNKVAQAKADDMKKNNYFDHNSPTYGSPFNMLKSFGVSYKTAGENIAKGQKTPQAVVNAWMNSEGHRANILNKNFKELGVGYTGGSSPYWVQMFIG